MPHLGNAEVNGNGHSDYDDDEEDIDFSDLHEQYVVDREEGLDTLIAVDGAPIVPVAKRETLLKIIKRKFGTYGRIKEDGIFMPMDESSGRSKGFIFIDYETPEQADATVKQLDRFPLDKNHTLLVNKLTDIEDYGKSAEEEDGEFVPPPSQEYHDRPHLRSWLADSAGRDQFVTLRGDEVSVWWNKKHEVPEQDVSRNHWTETYVQWSQLGTYLVSLHPQGVQIWGGPKWESLNRFPHPAVKLIDFSPCEKYMVTWSNEPLVLPSDGHRQSFVFTAEDQGKQLIVWDVQTGTVLRSFATSTGENQKQKMIWPTLKWSADDKYAARITQGQSISIYETPGMGLLDKKSFRIDGIVDFEWSPATSDKKGEELLCFWSPESANQTARVGLLSVPSKEIVRTRNLFNVSECRLHWQSRGDYLCVKVDRHTKTKKSTFTNLEFFRVNEKNIPVEVIELKDTVVNFAWEPMGERFVIISASDPIISGGPPKTSVSFYGQEKAKGATGSFRSLRTLEKKTSNGIFWSPKGRHVIVATVGGTSVFDLEFWDLDFEGEKKEADRELNSNLQLMATTEHYGMGEIEWDPSGRFVATSASIWRNTAENGYRIWDFRGTLLREEHLDRFKQFLWRPRPQTLLSKEEQKQVRKNLRDFSRIFEEEDAAELTMVNRELLDAQQRQLSEWRAWRERVMSRAKAERAELGIPDPAERQMELHEAGDEVIEEAVEEVLEEKEELVSNP